MKRRNEYDYIRFSDLFNLVMYILLNLITINFNLIYKVQLSSAERAAAFYW